MTTELKRSTYFLHQTDKSHHCFNQCLVPNHFPNYNDPVYWSISTSMAKSSNGNIFRVTGPVTGEFPSQRPVTRSFDVLFYRRLNKRLGKQSRRLWFEMPSRRSLGRHSVFMNWWIFCFMTRWNWFLINVINSFLCIINLVEAFDHGPFLIKWFSWDWDMNK